MLSGIDYFAVTVYLVGILLHPGLEDGGQALPILIRTLLPPGLGGLMFAAFLAGLMSTIDSIFCGSNLLVILPGADFLNPPAGNFLGNFACLLVQQNGFSSYFSLLSAYRSY